MTRVSAVGEYLRFRSALPPRLSELAILVTAAHWRQPYEWEIHAPIALEAGLPQAVLERAVGWRGASTASIPSNRRCYDLCIALHRDRTMFPRCATVPVAALGEQGAMDAIGICGYYALLAMVLNSQ